MDDRIIDFNELKNKAKDKDVDKLEDYMYSLYYQMAEGKITMADFTKNIYKYMEENNISQDKFLNIQKKLMERYGFDSSIIDEQLKSAGINLADVGNNYESIRKTMGFQEKYKDRLTAKAVSVYFIKNDKNNLEIILEEENVILQSEGKIDLADIELNEFLCSYKKVREEKPLAIKVCEDIKEYNY
ncbi:DUF3867 domain-containing protein [Clostridium sp. LP20]|uniref:DUF3867 domain-containing protein n=1 Tax=Clostridium sp. LP20 TaxID=3418665 RepID=UPI003EE4A521